MARTGTQITVVTILVAARSRIIIPKLEGPPLSAVTMPITNMHGLFWRKTCLGARFILGSGRGRSEPLTYFFLL
jgi:hypothetical protein